MAVTLLEEKLFRMQNVGFGKAVKLQFAAESSYVVNNMPTDKILLSANSSTGNNVILAESGPDLTVSFAAPETGTVYVSAVGIG